jgi:hypothetical protein
MSTGKLSPLALQIAGTQVADVYAENQKPFINRYAMHMESIVGKDH